MRYASNEANTVKPGCRFLNKPQLAQHLNISIYTVDSWVSQKRVPCVKLGGRKVLFDKEKIEKWIDEQRVDSIGKEKVDIVN